MKISKIKNIIISFLVVCFIFIGFFCFNNIDKVSSQELLVPQGSVNRIVGNDLILLLLQLKVIKLNTEIFDNKIFQNLKDFSFEIQPRSIGRQNPFSAIFGASSSSE
jgi:hypothetical protein